MNIIKRWPFSEDIFIAQVDLIPADVIEPLIRENLLDSHPALPWQEHLSDEIQQKHKQLKHSISSRFHLRLVAIHKGNIVALSNGWQQSSHYTEFYMGVSLVKQSFRNQGLYKKMLEIVLSETKEAGFSAIKSRHVNTNTPILIAKLKQGFIINGFELDDSMGPLLTMVYYHDDTRSRAARYRSGDIREKSILALLASTLEAK